jgi:hypothetical protein
MMMPTKGWADGGFCGTFYPGEGGKCGIIPSNRELRTLAMLRGEKVARAKPQRRRIKASKSLLAT